MTVVIPVYNGEAFLADAIGSVLVQTYEPVECVVVDDGSTDGTVAIAESYGDRIRIERKPNGGVASARNHGAIVAKGRFIAFLDADDCWLEGKLVKQMSVIRASRNIGLVYCGMYVTDRDLTRRSTMEAPAPDVALRNTLLLEPPVISIAQTSLLPAHVFRDVGGFDERLSTSADTDLACRVAARFPVAAVREPLVLYRQHEGQMHLNAEDMEHDMLIVYDKFFGSDLPDDVRRLRRRAYANLYYTLAAEALKNGDRTRAVRLVSKALMSHPLRVGALARARLAR